MGDEGTLEEGFTLDDVNIALKSFGEKAPGASGISKLYLTQAPENIKQSLTMVYNVALALGHFPCASGDDPEEDGRCVSKRISTNFPT